MVLTLYYAPYACSLASHIALKAAGLDYKVVKVDFATRMTENGDYYRKINVTGAVPALQLEDGTLLTQTVAILSYIGAVSKKPGYYYEDSLKQARLLEALAFAGDLQSGIIPYVYGYTDDTNLKRRLTELEAVLPAEGYWLGTPEPSSADIIAAVIINWTTEKQYDLSPWPKSAKLYKNVFEAQVTKEAIKEETS